MAGIIDDLTGIKTLQTGVKNNKVTRFAYTQNAYESNDVNGHTDYNVNRGNNIPTDSISVMKVNQTVVDKGFRARASSLTRMFLNHLFGRISYNLNKLNDLFDSTLGYIINYIGEPNGLVPLDSTGRIAYEYLPVDAIVYKGAWNASTNTPALADGTGTKGDTYFVTVAGTQDLGSGDITFFVDDRVIYNGSVWQRFSSGDVKTVSGIAPDVNGNVDLSQQTDMTKIFSPNFLKTLFKPLYGKLWIQGTSGTENTFTSVYYADGIWVACSLYHGLWWSTDGKNWTQGTGGTGYSFRSVYYAGGIWVAGSTSNGLWWSTDGKSWTRGTGGTAYEFYTVYGVNGIWIAGSYKHGLWRSTDGKAWTQITYGSTYTFNIVYYANGIWLAGSEEHGIWFANPDSTIPEGTVWIQGTGGTSYSFSGFHYADGICVACSLYHGLWWSTDGKNWTQGTGGTGYDFWSVYYANGIWVACSGGHGLWWSTDGKAWTQGTVTTGTFNTVYYADGIWVAGSYTHGAWQSTDGKNWTQSTGGTGAYTFNIVYYADETWVAGTDNHGLWCSNWETIADFFAQGGTL